MGGGGENVVNMRQEIMVAVSGMVRQVRRVEVRHEAYIYSEGVMREDCKDETGERRYRPLEEKQWGS